MSPIVLGPNRYGKQRVRVLKLLRTPEKHLVKELTVSILLHGDYTGAYLGDDNSALVPTDTVKNTIHILAKDHLEENTEAFTIQLADHFLNRYRQIEFVEVDTRERVWSRMTVGGAPHPHSFIDRGQGTPLVSLQKSRRSFTLWSGITDLIVMKTTESAFIGYSKCENTTLEEATDRIVSTSICARWNYTTLAADFPILNEIILSTMLDLFATNFSPSVQRTLFQMGEAALNKVDEITAVEMKLPNKHYLGIDMTPFGRENTNDIFLPTDEPHGQIEAIVQRS